EARGETYALSVPCNFTVRFEQDIKTFLPPVKSKAKRTGRPRLKPEPTPMPPQYRVDWLIDKIPQVTGRSSAGETAAKESLRNSLLS
ncbi:MAG: hypothetical protein QME73_14530, partial [Bacillota bacterium]|nr:hypothetical protein [Bacillota bacterium]